MSRRTFTRSEKWLFAILLPLMSLIIGVGSFNAYINRDPVVVIPTPVPTPQPNGFDLYVQAGLAIRTANPPVDPLRDWSGYKLTPSQKASRCSLARRERWLQSNRAGLILFQRAQSLPCRVPAARSFYVSNATSLQLLRDLGWNKMVEANIYKMRGQWCRAADTALDILEMANHVSTGGGTVSFLTSSANRSAAYLCLEDIPSHLTGPEARRLTVRMESLYPAADSMARAMEEDKWVDVTQNLESMRLSRWRDPPPWTELSPWQRFKLKFLTKQAIIDDTLRVHDYAIEITSAKPGTPLATPPQNLNDVAAVLVPVFQDNILKRNATFARAGLVLHRLALRTYRGEHGRYPDSLDALIPGYLSHAYLDPFGNGRSKYHYRKQGDSYRLWSVGSDNVDNGGKSVPRVQRKNQILITWPNPVKGDNVVGP